MSSLIVTTMPLRIGMIGSLRKLVLAVTPRTARTVLVMDNDHGPESSLDRNVLTECRQNLIYGLSIRSRVEQGNKIPRLPTVWTDHRFAFEVIGFISPSGISYAAIIARAMTSASAS